jgi:molecular chaperone DnaJ
MLQPSRKPIEKALEYHPDKILETEKKKEKEAAEAYEILNDASKKAKYDQYGHQAFDGSGGFGGGGHGMNMDDIFSHIFGMPLEAVADLEAVVEASVELKEVTRIKVKLTLEETNGVEKR